MNENKSIEFVKRFLIPFVNAKSDKEKLESFENIAKDGIAFLMDRPKLKIVIADNANLKLVSEKIKQTHEIILKMLRIALIDGEFAKLYPEYTCNKSMDLFEKYTDLEIYLKNTLIQDYYNKSILIWRDKGLRTRLLKDLDYKELYQTIESIIIDLLVENFQSEFDFSDDDKTIDAIGYKYFAICPKCGKFFYKKRKDMIFDSEKCRLAQSQKRFRIKNKTK